MNEHEVDFVIRVWEIVRTMDNPKTLREISGLAGLTKSHTEMVLIALESKELVVQEGERYRRHTPGTE